MAQLTWSLVVATYNRPQVLRACLGCAALQTRPPAGIVIIDASDDWEANRDATVAFMVAQGFDLPLDYRGSPEKSLSIQRRHGLRCADADILFLIDDDSFMHPDCAEKIMAVYEQDPQGRIAGVQAKMGPPPPGFDAHVAAWVGAPMAAQTRVDRAGLFEGDGPLRRTLRLVRDKVLMISPYEYFVPYDGHFWQHDTSHITQPINVVKLFNGCRMTFRRVSLLREPPENILLFYSPAEDLDLSYRISRTGALVTAIDAKLHHFESATARLKRFDKMLLSLLNKAVLIRRHAADQQAIRRRWKIVLWRLMLAAFLRDLLARRFEFSGPRAIRAAMRLQPQVWAVPEADLETWYKTLQRDVVEGRAAQRLAAAR